MERETLAQALMNLDRHAADDTFYVADGSPIGGDSLVDLVPFERATGRIVESRRYFLEVGVAREVIEDFESRAGRPLTASERVRAVTIYAERDAGGSLEEVLDP